MKSLGRVGFRYAWAAGLLLLAGASVSCRNGTRTADENELRDPAMRRAIEQERSGAEEAAIQTYRDILEKNPRMARAHMALGFLLDRADRDYVEAIYHYRRYLQMRPETEKRAMIESRMEAARDAFAATLTPTGGVAHVPLVTVNRQVADMRQEIQRLQGMVRQLGGEVATGAVASVAAAGPAGTPATQVPAAPPPERPLEPRAASPAPEVRTYTVQRGDSLMRIAGRVYGNSGRWTALYEANRRLMRNPQDLRVGQVLVVPP